MDEWSAGVRGVQVTGRVLQGVGPVCGRAKGANGAKTGRDARLRWILRCAAPYSHRPTAKESPNDGACNKSSGSRE